MKKLVTIITLSIATIGFSQTTIEKSSISSGGNSTTIGTVSMVSTIGEVAIGENTVGNIHISEGFISSKTLKTLGIQKYQTLEGIKVYPNPAVDFVNINFTAIDHYEITIFDYSGKELNTIKTNKTEQQVNLKTYSSGIYILLIKNSAKQVYKTFKIIIE